MKKRFQYIVLVVLLIIVFCACKKDLGNYDYKDANVITITTDTANVDRNVVITADSIVVKTERQPESEHIAVTGQFRPMIWLLNG
jgi:hypothetical protein